MIMFMFMVMLMVYVYGYVYDYVYVYSWQDDMNLKLIECGGKLEKKLVFKKKKVNTTHPLYDKNIVMTGFRDKDLAARIADITGKPLKTSVSKNTFVVLVKNTDEDTGKAEEARALGIPLMTPESFIKKYMN